MCGTLLYWLQIYLKHLFLSQHERMDSSLLTGLWGSYRDAWSTGHITHEVFCLQIHFFVWWSYIWSILTYNMEKAMVTHSSTLAWKITWTEGPGGLQSMGSLGVGHDWATSLSLFTFMHWRRKWQPIQIFLPGESQGWGSLVGCRLWGRTESDTTEVT